MIHQHMKWEAPEFTDERILVIGGVGFVGSNLIKSLREHSPRKIVILDNLLSSERSSVHVSPEITFIEGSIADDQILQGLTDDFGYIFHLATFHGNQNSIYDPLADHENNTLTTLKLYERVKNFKKIKKVVYSSAGCTFAENALNQTVAIREDSPLPIYFDTPYQISKIIGELYSNYFYRQYHLPVVKVRFQNVYGPGEILGAGKWRGTLATVWRNVIPTFVYHALKKWPLIVENKGIATRDFIYVDDIIRGLMLCAIAGIPGEVYNLASGAETSILNVATLINCLTGNTAAIQYGPKRIWDHSNRRFGSTVKSKRELGFEAKTSLHEGLSQTIEWTQQNSSLIDACIQKHSVHMENAPCSERPLEMCRIS